MSGRPEGNDFGGYNAYEPEPYDRDAWQEFTPFRPGDAQTREPAAPQAAEPVSKGFQWTEPQGEDYGVGDRVRSVKRVGGMLGGAVPEGTIGEVVGTRSGIFDDYVTVRFNNGYTEEVSPTDLEHKGWYD